MKILKFICWLIGIAVFLSGLFPFFYGIFLIGSLVLFCIAALIIALPYLLVLFRNHNWLRNAVVGIYMAGVLIALMTFSSIFKQAYFNKPPETGKLTAITLGSKVNGNQPSLMLKNRLLLTKAYLDSNPDAIAIMTGGQGADEDFPEGLVMSSYLISLGVEPHRILIEDTSTNTLENLQNAKPMIPADSDGVIIISDDFHQKRASMLAKIVGIEDNYALSSQAPIGLIPMYWAREIGGVLYTWLASFNK